MRQPLAGRRVLVTRARERAAGMVDALHSLGAEVVVVPFLATEPIADPADIVAAAAALAGRPPPRWVAFTSATAVRLVMGVIDAAALDGASVAAVGDATAAALLRTGVASDVVASQASASGLAAAMATREVDGGHVWFPSAQGAGDALPAWLRARGATVHVTPIYRTVMPEDAPRRLTAALRRPIDAIALTSGSAARHLVAALGERPLPAGTAIACIGEQTAEAARAAGLRVDVVAESHTGAGLAAAIAGHLVQPLR